MAGNVVGSKDLQEIFLMIPREIQGKPRKLDVVGVLFCSTEGPSARSLRATGVR
jgi:hypothetical protein